MNKRLFSALLALVMALGMLPMSAFAEETPPTEAYVAQLTPTMENPVEEIVRNGEKTAKKITVTVNPEGNITWSEKDPSIKRYSSGWWVGIDIIAPGSVTTQEAAKKVIYYKDREAGQQKFVKEDGSLDMADGTNTAGRYHMTAWSGIPDGSSKYTWTVGENESRTGSFLQRALEVEAQMNRDLGYTWYFDWDGNSETGAAVNYFASEEAEQENRPTEITGIDTIVTLKYKVNAVRLLKQNNASELAWPVTPAAADVRIRPTGHAVTGAEAENPDFDYSKAYEAAGIDYKDGKITVDQAKTLALIEKAKADTDAAGQLYAITKESGSENAKCLYIGMAIKAPEGATAALIGGKFREIPSANGEGNDFFVSDQDAYYISYYPAIRADGALCTVNGSDGTKTWDKETVYWYKEEEIDGKKKYEILSASEFTAKRAAATPAPIETEVTADPDGVATVDETTAKAIISAAGLAGTVDGGASAEKVATFKPVANDDSGLATGVAIPKAAVETAKENDVSIAVAVDVTVSEDAEDGSETKPPFTVTLAQAALTKILSKVSDGNVSIKVEDKKSESENLADGALPANPPEKTELAAVYEISVAGSDGAIHGSSDWGELADGAITLEIPVAQAGTYDVYLDGKPLSGDDGETINDANTEVIKVDVPHLSVAALYLREQDASGEDSSQGEYTISLDASAIPLKIGDKKTLRVKAVKPEDAEVEWTIDNKTVVSMVKAEDGRSVTLKAEAEGKAVITASILDDENKPVAAKCTVTVTKKGGGESGNGDPSTKPDDTQKPNTPGGSSGGGGSGSGKPSVKQPGETQTPNAPTAPGGVAGFNDVAPGAWYADAVKYVVEKGLFGGVGSGNFAPDANMTRAMMWTVLARYMGVDTSTGSNWYEAARAWAIEKGISDGTMADGNVTREQFVTMLWRLSGEPAVSNSASFTDSGSVSAYAKAAVDWAVAQGIVNGYNDGSFKPQGSATRAEVAKMLTVFCTNAENAPVETTPAETAPAPETAVPDDEK